MTKRKPDPLWDVAVELCNGGGRGPITKSERGKWNKYLGELREAGATPEQLRAAIPIYRKQNKKMPCTPKAIAGQWGRLLADGKVPRAEEIFRAMQRRWHDISLADQDRIAGQISLPAERYVPQKGMPPPPTENFATKYMVSESPRLLGQALAIWDKEQH